MQKNALFQEKKGKKTPRKRLNPQIFPSLLMEVRFIQSKYFQSDVILSC